MPQPPDPLPQYAGLYAEWPEVAGNLVRYGTYRYFDVEYPGEAVGWYEPGAAPGCGSELSDAAALALCRSAAMMELSKRGYGLVPAFSYNQNEGAWGLHDHEGCTRYVDGPTFDAACIQALRAVRGEGK